jgi:hypothetical protein
MALAFATPQDALDATHTRTAGMVLVDGISVDAIAWDTQHGVDQATSTCRFDVPLPRPAGIVANAAVSIQGGHNDLAGTFFSGRIPSWQSSMTMRGDVLSVRAVGWSSLLNERERFELSYDGPITISALFDSFCARRAVPSYRADTVTDPTGTIEITMGGNPSIDDGKVIIPASQTLLGFLNNAAEPYGYRVYDAQDGTVRLSRVSGLPVGDPVVTFTEGVHLMSGQSEYDIGGIVNYWDVQGQTYEDAYGASVPIRAFPATIVSDDLIPVNDGIRYREYRNSLIVRQQQAEIIRARLEIDTSEPETPVRWEAVAVPGVSVGDVVAVDCETIEANANYWLMSMDVRGDDGLTARYDGWLGAGQSMPSGDNSTEYEIQTTPIHLGNETLSHYAVPVPSGTSDTWNITIPDRATAVNVRGLHHGTNSQLIGGVNTDIEVTKWQIWTDGTTDFSEDGEDAPRPETSGNMPIVNEDLLLRRDYTNLANWSPFAINLGRLDAADYILRLVSGVKASWDDFEVRDVVLEVWGIAEPLVIPGEDV